MRDIRRELSGLAIPPNPVRALREIGSAWERFVGTGELWDDDATSRHRARLAAEPRARDRPLHGAGPRKESRAEEIETILTREDLGQAGRGVLEDFGSGGGGHRARGRPGGRQGRILHAAGHSGSTPSSTV